MNTNDLWKLLQWRERGGLTAKEYVDWIANGGDSEGGIHLHDMETNMALALHDFLVVLDVGQFDIDLILGAENMEFINTWLNQEIIPLNEGVVAYRMAKVLFEPERSLEDYGLIPITVEFSDQVWDALEESKDERFVVLGPIVLDQNTRTIYMASETSLEALWPGTCLMTQQIGAAIRAMRR